MITIKFDGKDIKIPNEIHELTIKQYQDIMTVDKSINKFDRFKTILNRLTGVESSYIESMGSQEINQIVNSIIIMIKQTDHKLKTVIKLNGEYYKFEDLLDRIRFDQWVDLVELTDSEDLITNNLHIICAILYRKVDSVDKGKFSFIKWIKKQDRKFIYNVNEYDSSTIMEQAEIFKEHLTMDVVFGLVFFLSNLRLEYLTRLRDYLEAKKKEK